ncbi:hypothetical protein ACFLYK_00445 [Candidatus Cloacimonadota bacterium]
MSQKTTDGFFILDLGILDYVHEFVISDDPEIFPTILFGLMLARGVTRIIQKTAKYLRS